MCNLAISAPWNTYQKKIKALFGRDPDIIVGEIIEPKDGSADYAFNLEVRKHTKYEALERVLPKVKEFGKATLRICLYDEENASVPDDAVSLYNTIFDGNPIVKDIREMTDQTGSRHSFVRFKPEVIQFFNDDASDYNGNWSGLAQDIAREVFEDEYRGIHFCTAPVNEAADDPGKALGKRT